MTAVGATRNIVRWCAVLMVVFTVACSDRAGESASAPVDSKHAAIQTVPAERTAFSQETPEKLGLRFLALEAARDKIPRDTFDPQAIVQKIGKDPVDLYGWVRDNTYWVPYRGAMRGPVGVLMDRFGNSLDRSLLLAELLRTAGHEVQLARGVIDNENAKQLLDQIRRAPPDPVKRPPPASPDVIAAEVGSYAREFQLDAERMLRNLATVQSAYKQLSGEVNQRLAKQPAFLIEAVGSPAAPNDAESKAATSLSDHWWVQLRKEGQWVDLDTLLPNAKPATALVAAAAIFPFKNSAGEISLASKYVHEMSIRVIVEQWKDGTLTESVALDHAFRPAELLGEAISFQNVPLGWSQNAESWRAKAPLESFMDKVLGQTEWLPQLYVGDRSVSQASVNEHGELNLDPASGQASEGPGGMAETLGGFDEFGGGEELPEADGYFTAEWIEYEIRIPGEAPRRVRREVFDMLPAESRSASPVVEPTPNQARRLNRAMNLMGSVLILPVVSRPSHEYALHRTILEALGNREAIAGMQAKLRKQDTKGASEQARLWKPTTERLLDLSLARFEWSGVGQDVYLSAPNILTYRRTLTHDARGEFSTKQGFDIVSNAIAVRRLSKMTPFDVRVRQGAADTNVEAVLTGDVNTNVGSMLHEGIPEQSWVTLRELGDLATLGSSWPADDRARIGKALESGYVIVAPRLPKTSDQRDHWAWWQINPTTGETLGIGEQGWGAATEQAVLTPTAIKGAVMAGAITAEVVFIVCMSKKVLTGKFPPATVQEHDDMYASCACAGLDSGANVTGIVLGGYSGTVFLGGWLGGVSGAAMGVGGAQAFKEAICG